MTVVNVVPAVVALATGSTVTSGTFSAVPWRASGPAIITQGARVVFPEAIDVPVTVSGPSTPIDLVPADGTWCWAVTITVGPKSTTRYVTVPGTGPVDFADLIDVDPATFAPTGDVVAAWQAAASTATTAASASAGSASAAAASASTASAAATAASMSASSAQDAQTSAASSASSASQAADTATTAAASVSDMRTDLTTGRLSDAALKTMVGNTRARLAARAGYDTAQSNGYAQAGQATASSFAETWADTTAWAGAGVQVSAGKLFGTTGGGGIGHAFRVAPGVLARVTFTIDWVANGTSGQGILIGFARNTVGGSVPGGGSQSRGLYFRSTGTVGAIHGIDNGTQDGTALFQGFSNSTWVVTATVDENWYSLVAVCPATGDVVLRRFARNDSTFPLNNLTIMVNDARGLTGSDVRAITEARIGALATGATTAGAIGGHWSSVDGDNFLILTPASYDSRKPSPVVMLFHGNGSDETYWTTIFNGKAQANAFLAAGFIVVGAANTGAVSTWGADAGLDAYSRAYQYTRDHYNTGAVAFYANSMGGIESLNVLARDVIPGVAAWVGTVPTYNLAENHSNALFTATIDAAYGGNFAVNAQGHDPAAMSPLSFRGIPMWMMIATDDTTVTPSANGYALYSAVAQTNPVVKVEVTGGHTSGQIATQASTIAAWVATQIGMRTTWAP